jgi:hypothetical protein
MGDVIAILLGIPGKLKLYAAAILAAIVGALAIYSRGRADAKARRAVQDLTEHKDTVERVLNETPSDDPADDIRKRLRDRARKP